VPTGLPWKLTDRDDPPAKASKVVDPRGTTTGCVTPALIVALKRFVLLASDFTTT
jgi:hypothetical protein